MAKYSKRASGILAVLADRTVAYHPKLAIALGGVKDALFVCQLLYWDGRGRDPKGWIWKTVDEMTEETGLSYGEQRGARKKLKKMGVLEEKRKGVPAKLWYRLDFDVLGQVVEEAFKNCEKAKSRSDQTPDQELAKPQIKSCENVRSNTENTSKNTSETTSKEDPKFPDGNLGGKESPVRNSDIPTQDIPITEEPITEDNPPVSETSHPACWPGWRDAIRSGNGPAVIVRMCKVLYPDHDPPGFGLVGAVTKRTCNGDYARLGAALWEHSARPVNGDVLLYVEGIIKGGKWQGLRRSGLGTNPKTGLAEPASAAGLRAWMEKNNITEEDVWKA